MAAAVSNLMREVYLSDRSCLRHLKNNTVTKIGGSIINISVILSRDTLLLMTVGVKILAGSTAVIQKKSPKFLR